MDWWGGQGFGDWVWNVAFDGIGSTAVATGVAVYFVLHTLRNDRDLATNAAREQVRLERELAFEAGCQRLLDGARNLLGGSRVMHSSDVKPWLTDLWHLALSTPADDDVLRRIMQAAHQQAFGRVQHITGGVGYPEVVNVIESVEDALQKRLAIPTYFRDVDAEVADEAVAEVASGAGFRWP